uniref:Putative secreted peptide n=1 Tax=Anopheles braziliensis TaxID=58242 RepID=A0A2M3ZTS6_9DIPT
MYFSPALESHSIYWLPCICFLCFRPVVACLLATRLEIVNDNFGKAFKRRLENNPPTRVPPIRRSRAVDL